MPTSLTRIAVAATALAALAACSSEASSDGDDPPTSAAPTPSASPTEEPGPVEPTLPEAATKEGKAGAEAFVEYYWEVVDYARATGDTDLLSSLQNDFCTACTTAREGIEETYARGGSIIGGSHTIAAIQAAEVSPSTNTWIIGTEIKTTPERVQNAGDRNARNPAGTTQVVHTASFRDSQWRMSDLDPR